MLNASEILGCWGMDNGLFSNKRWTVTVKKWKFNEGEGTNSYVSNPNPRKWTSLNPKHYSMCSVFEVEPCVQIGRWSSFLPWDALCVSRMLATCRSNAAWILQCTLTAGNQAMIQKLTDHIRHTAQTKITSYGWGPVTDTPKSLAMWLHATTQTTQHGEQCHPQGTSQSFTLQDRMFSSGWAHFFWPLIVDYEDTETWKSPTLQWVTWAAMLVTNLDILCHPTFA